MPGKLLRLKFRRHSTAFDNFGLLTFETTPMEGVGCECRYDYRL